MILARLGSERAPVASSFVSRVSRFLAVPLLFGLASCASTPSEPPSPAELAGSQATRIAVTPMNIVIPLPDRLKGSTAIVRRALEAHIEDNEKTLEWIDFRLARALWIESAAAVREAGQEESFENAARVFARRVAARAEVDALIVPSVYIQNARIMEDKAYWDSTNQKIELIGKSKWEIETPPISTIEAASVLVHVFDRNGELLHERRTGLELIQHLGIRRERRQGQDKRTWVPTDDEPAIESERRVRAAIAHSLSPFLPK